jgi:hypothetical protein
MPLVFTDEFIESLKPARNPFERAYIAQLAKDADAAKLCGRIETSIAMYPADKREKYRGPAIACRAVAATCAGGK